MDAISMIGFLSNITSLILAVLAIVLSILFYKMSNTASSNLKDAAKEIAANVERLEKLFDRLYADTFSMVKDTVTDMRRYIYSDIKLEGKISPVEEKTKQKMDDLMQHLEAESNKLLETLTEDNKPSEKNKGEMMQIIKKAVAASKKIEESAKEETLREILLKAMRELKNAGKIITLLSLSKKVGLPEEQIVDEVFRLSKEKLVFSENLPQSLATKEEITLAL